MSEGQQGPTLDPAPQARARMIALAAEALGRMPTAHVPPRLRKAASFAPSKRAKLVGTQMAEVVDSDPEFRDHLAVQVRALAPGTVEELQRGSDAPAAGLADRAAVAYLLRDEGWEKVVQAAVEAEEADTSARPDTQVRTGEPDSRGRAHRLRERLQPQIDAAKAENSKLRRRLGEARRELKDLHEQLDASRQETDEARHRADVDAREADAEVRRLRQRVAELEADLSVVRRTGREQRDDQASRLRLLLDTVVGAARGLQQELALPPVRSLPADGVSAVPADHSRAGAARSVPSDDVGLLRQLLDLPRVHLVIDGYNVSKTAWPSTPLDQQRTRLVGLVAGLVSGKRVETTVVFDGADLESPPAVKAPRGVRVLFSPGGVIADDVIRDLVDAEPPGRMVVMVSSDRELAASVAERGARPIGSPALIRALGN